MSAANSIQNLKKKEMKHQSQAAALDRERLRISDEISKLRKKREREMKDWGHSVFRTKDPNKIRENKQKVEATDKKIEACLKQMSMVETKMNREIRLELEAYYQRMALENPRIVSRTNKGKKK